MQTGPEGPGIGDREKDIEIESGREIDGIKKIEERKEYSSMECIYIKYIEG